MKPNFSQTLLLNHLYLPNPDDTQDPREHFEEFYEEILEECLKFGEVEELVVCENLGDHMVGNVYVKFSDEEMAEKALIGLSGRFYAGRLIQAEYSPVTEFREGRCQQFDEHTCSRGGYCNFLHLKPTPRWARKYFCRGRRYDRDKGEKSGKSRRRRSRSRNRRGYRKFPIRGTSEERRQCIKEWNREREKRMAEMEKIHASGA